MRRILAAGAALLAVGATTDGPEDSMLVARTAEPEPRKPQKHRHVPKDHVRPEVRAAWGKDRAASPSRQVLRRAARKKAKASA